MTSDQPRRLSLIGYWSDGNAPDSTNRWPDPRDLKTEWDHNTRRRVVAYLKKGTAFRWAAGSASCVICKQRLGSAELTDGVWAWPEGLDHYVDAHSVGLPDAFVATCSTTPPRILKPITSDWLIDDSEWVRWAGPTIRSRPPEDTATLDEARSLCHALSHSAWHAQIEETSDERWRLTIVEDGRSTTTEHEKAPIHALERHLMFIRKADPNAILDIAAANTIARDYDAMVGLNRLVVAEADRWIYTLTLPDQQPPPDGWIAGLLKRIGNARSGMIGVAPGGALIFALSPCDERMWRWVLRYNVRPA